MDTYGDLSKNPQSPLLDLEDVLQMNFVTELYDDQFEPQTRARSNTWHCPPRVYNFAEQIYDSEITKASTHNVSTKAQQASRSVRKIPTRKNAWGSFSYADLITQAITSAPERRLTLSEIYEWMVQNVDYFRNKGESNSSAGWKNSIRHNLSLHNRFMRVQNEGTSKSSWWMVNPDAKQEKSKRGRAASMETSKMEKRRSRVKRRVEALRNAGISTINHQTHSSSSSVSEGLDMFPDSPGLFRLSPDFRPRASSNASSYGCFSPIPAIVEVDQNDYENSTTTPAKASILDQLAGALADELTLQQEFIQGYDFSYDNQSGISIQPLPPYQSIHQFTNIGQNQCSFHKSMQCSCLYNIEGFSPVTVNTEISPAYLTSEQSMKPLPNYNTLMKTVRDSWDSNESLVHQKSGSNLDGQCMDAVSSQTQLEEFQIDNFQGGLECNIDELIQQEMNIDGRLDISIPFSISNLFYSSKSEILQ